MDEDEDAVGSGLRCIDPLARHAARVHRFIPRTLGQRHAAGADHGGFAQRRHGRLGPVRGRPPGGDQFLELCAGHRYSRNLLMRIERRPGAHGEACSTPVALRAQWTRSNGISRTCKPRTARGRRSANAVVVGAALRVERVMVRARAGNGRGRSRDNRDHVHSHDRHQPSRGDPRTRSIARARRRASARMASPSPA